MADFLIKIQDRVPTFAGIKFANANVDDLSRAQRSANERFKIIVASNHVRYLIII